MARRFDQGQVVTEAIWSLLLILTIMSALIRVYHATERMQKKDRWEVHQESRR